MEGDEMTNKEYRSILTLVGESKELAYKRLKNNPCYMMLDERQRQTEEVVEAMYRERFTKDERLAIRRHYEGETEKCSIEDDEVYFQGLKDGFQLVLGLLAN